MGEQNDGDPPEVEGGPFRKVDADDFIIELRTHGVSGTPPDAMLNTSAVVQVWGDQTGRFFRPANTLGDEVWEVAPVETEPGTSVRRFREGYHWGKMTSGGSRQALWALLVPFALVNLSQWMVPPTVPGGWVRRLPVNVLRALVRVVGLGLTVVLMVQFSVLVADLFAVQCLGQRQCLTSWSLLDWIRGHPLPITIVVVLVLAIPVFGASRITAQARERICAKPEDPGTPPRKLLSEKETGLDALQPVPRIAADDFYNPRQATSARTLHATVGLAAVALSLGGGWSRPTSPHAVVPWVLAIGLLVVGLVLAAFMDDPRGTGGRFRGGHCVNCVLFGDEKKRAVWWAAGCVVLAASAYLGYLPVVEAAVVDQAAVEPSWRDGIDTLLQYLFVGLASVCVAALVAAAFAAVQSYRAYFSPSADTPKVFRPWSGGIATAVILPFAALLGAGLGTGLAQTVKNCMTTSCRPALLSTATTGADRPNIVLPKSYDAIALLWGITGTMVGVLALVLTLSALVYVRIGSSLAVPTRVQSPGQPTPTTWFFAGLKVRADAILCGVVVVAVYAGVVSALVKPTRFADVVRDCRPLEVLLDVIGITRAARVLREGPGTRWVPTLESIGLLVLGAIVIGLLYAIYNAYRRPDSAGRSLGVLWDLASFWPTESHPLVPPCYARKAINDLTERVRWLHQKYPRARIVLCGHSQGSLLMYATVLRLAHLGESEALSKVGLVTHGSQLQWAYGRAFPDMLSYASHVALMARLGDRWHNLIRFSDPLGGPVLSWAREPYGEGICGSALPGGGQRYVLRAEASGALAIGNERLLPDPVLHKPILPARKHSDYTLDAQWDAVVALAAREEPEQSDEPSAGLPADEDA